MSALSWRERAWRVGAAFALVGLVGMLAFQGLRSGKAPHLVAPHLVAKASEAAGAGGVAGAAAGNQSASILSHALTDAIASLPGVSIAKAYVEKLSAGVCETMDCLSEESSLRFEDAALRHGLRLVPGLATGTPEHRLAFWQTSTEYIRSLDLSVAKASLRVRNWKGKDIAGSAPGSEFCMIGRAPDQAASDRPLYEVILSGVRRTGLQQGESRVRLGLIMAHDAPDGSWRLCGVNYYDVPTSQAMHMVPIAYPARDR